jgi:outer membrane protein OmpA-like peptidoglycan-associated protein
MKRHIWFMLAIPVLIISWWAPPAAAESGDFNVHLEGAAALGLGGWQSEELGVGISGAGRFEYPLAKWIGIEAGGGYLQFFKGRGGDGYQAADQAYLVNVNAGARLRLSNDEGGYLWPWGVDPAHVGNLWGNFWFDLHLDYYRTGSLNRFGGDFGAGAEFSLVNGLQIGPLVRVHYVRQPDSENKRDSQDAWILLAGLSFSVAIPPQGLRMTDTDGDGIYDPYDRCVKQPEDRDGFQDTDGCPDLDNDKDGIPDIVDNCPNVPEDLDGYLDTDGCPDLDNDSDGLPDKEDPCPNEAEDKDGYQDLDGCADDDNDNDGVKDRADQCPNEPETVNGFKDDDGCPERDSDGDGIVDLLDKCPNEPETVNGLKDDDGCPDTALVEVRENKIATENRVFFDFASSRIKSSARAVLNDLAKLLESHPEYVRVSLEGHTDTRGTHEFNLALSTKRAESVKKYLIAKGIDPDRLVIKGLGDSAPWVTKDGAALDERNRRVEIRIEDIDEARAAVPVSKDTRDAVKSGNKEPSDVAGKTPPRSPQPTENRPKNSDEKPKAGGQIP